VPAMRALFLVCPPICKREIYSITNKQAGEIGGFATQIKGVVRIEQEGQWVRTKLAKEVLISDFITS